MDIKVSVIVPVYNVEDYVEKCLRSIINQSHKNWEALVVVDGATDNSLEICKKIEAEDLRIQVLVKENGGLASARNFAFNKITGEYVAFVDSDDYLEPEYLEVLLKNAVEHNALISMCGYTYETEDGKEIYHIQKETKPLSKEEIIDSMYVPLNHSWGSFVWNKLYLSKIIKENNLFFNEELKMFEDILFNYHYISLIDSGYFCTEPLYHYLKRGSSLINNFNSASKEKYLYYTKAFDIILESSKGNDKLYYKWALLMKCIHTATALRVMSKLGLCKNPRYIEERNFLRKNIMRLLFNNNIPIKKRVGALITLLSPELGYKLWNEHKK